MCINGQLYTVMSILLPILVWIGLTIVIYKKFKNYYGVVIGVLVSGMMFAFFQVGVPKVYIVNNNLKVKSVRVIGGVNYQMDNGTQVDLQHDPMEVMVVNNSSVELMLEEIIYGPDFYFNKQKYDDVISSVDSTHDKKANDPRIFYIESYNTGSFRLAHQRIDYFFDEEMPRKIKEYGTSNKKKYRLRKAPRKH